MKIVIIGDGKVGYLLAKQLSEYDYDVVLIDNNSKRLKQTINELDINCVEGNGVSSQILLEANANEADLVISCTPMDEVNMICSLMAKKLGAGQTVARVRNPIYYQEMDLLKNDLELDVAINPDFAMAQEIARVLIFPAAIKVETFVKGRVELVELKIPPENPLQGQTLADIYKKYKIKFLICAVQRGEEIFIPNGSFILEAKDKINVIASHHEIKRFFKIIGTYRTKVKTVMICGGSKTAYYLAQKLLSLGMNVKIIEKNEAGCRELSDMLPKATIIWGNAAEHELLQEEGITRADAFLALTGVDEENIIMSLYAQSQNVPKVITKVNSDSLHSITNQLELDSVVSPKRVTANAIISYVRAMENSLSSDHIETLYRLVDDKLEALEFIAKEHAVYINIPLKQLPLKENILVACIVRKRKTIIPDGDEIILAGDSVIIVTKNPVNKLADIIRE